MKIRGLFKKAAATLMAAVTALSILPATTAFAAGDIGTISFSHTYDSSSSATLMPLTLMCVGTVRAAITISGATTAMIFLSHGRS